MSASSWSTLVGNHSSHHSSPHTASSSSATPSARLNGVSHAHAHVGGGHGVAKDDRESTPLDAALLDFYLGVPQSSADLPKSRLQPRGLDNRNNSCFMNAVLQSLLSCREFGALLGSLRKSSASASFSLPPATAALVSTFGEHAELSSASASAPQGSLGVPSRGGAANGSAHSRSSSVASANANVSRSHSPLSKTATATANGHSNASVRRKLSVASSVASAHSSASTSARSSSSAAAAGDANGASTATSSSKSSSKSSAAAKRRARKKKKQQQQQQQQPQQRSQSSADSGAAARGTPPSNSSHEEEKNGVSRSSTSSSAAASRRSTISHTRTRTVAPATSKSASSTPSRARHRQQQASSSSSQNSGAGARRSNQRPATAGVRRKNAAPFNSSATSASAADTGGGMRWANWRGIPFYPSSMEPEARQFTARDTFGAQQDAHEFLQYLVDKMHSELTLKARVLAQVKKSGKGNSDDDGDQSVSDDWQEVGKRNRKQLVRAKVGFARSPLSDLLGGRMRIALKSRGAQDSVSYEPFFTFPLEVADQRVRTIEQAFRASIDREQVQGFKGKANYEVSASRTATLDALPRVFILHLKRFQFDDYGTASKITRHVRFSETFSVPQKYVFGAFNSDRSTSYSLQAAIIHRGHSSSGGHYVTCVKHDQLGWILCDDRSLQKVEQHYVLSQPAYMLFYRRMA